MTDMYPQLRLVFTSDYILSSSVFSIVTCLESVSEIATDLLLDIRCFLSSNAAHSAAIGGAIIVTQ